MRWIIEVKLKIEIMFTPTIANGITYSANVEEALLFLMKRKTTTIERTIRTTTIAMEIRSRFRLFLYKLYQAESNCSPCLYSSLLRLRSVPG